MKIYEGVHDYNYKWSLVSAANWQKYPNENCPHVKHVDVLQRFVDPATGILYTERLFTVKQNVPTIILKVWNLYVLLLLVACNVFWLMNVPYYLFQILGSGTTHYVRETSAIDPKTKTLTMKSYNLTMGNLLRVEETMRYREHPTDKNK